VLKGKTCVNEQCKKIIPQSATSCPYCGSNQIAIILDPWVCKVCGKKNVATDSICKDCGSPKGANHPLSKDELLASSDKVDSMSSDGISITLADGSKSNSVKVQVYSSHKPLSTPASNASLPLIIHKEIGNLTIFIVFFTSFLYKVWIIKRTTCS